MDPTAGVQVFSEDGKYLRNVPGAPSDFHGFVIHKDADGEFIYGAGVGSGNIMKMTLDGKVLLNIPSSAIPDEFKKVGKGGKVGVRLTAMDVAPNGDLYVSDGYSSDYVHRFDKAGKYLKSFGGKKAPYNFNTLHKIAIDTRFTPAPHHWAGRSLEQRRRARRLTAGAGRDRARRVPRRVRPRDRRHARARQPRARCACRCNPLPERRPNALRTITISESSRRSTYEPVRVSLQRSEGLNEPGSVLRSGAQLSTTGCSGSMARIAAPTGNRALIHAAFVGMDVAQWPRLC